MEIRGQLDRASKTVGMNQCASLDCDGSSINCIPCEQCAWTDSGAQ